MKKATVFSMFFLMVSVFTVSHAKGYEDHHESGYDREGYCDYPCKGERCEGRYMDRHEYGDDRGRHCEGPYMDLERMRRHLNLSDKQYNEIKNMQEEFFEKQKPRIETMREEMRKIREMRRRGSADKETMRQSMDRFHFMKMDMMSDRMDLHEKIKNVLNEDQRRRIEEQREDRMKLYDKK